MAADMWLMAEVTAWAGSLYCDI